MSFVLQRFRYFLAVTQELNISRAAKKLFISQQALSDQMIKLERRYAVPLFVRDSRGHIISLTTYGKKLVVTSRNILKQEADFVSACKSVSKRVGRIRFGITPTLARLLIPHVLPEFSKFFPDTEFMIKTDCFGKLEKYMTEGQLDLLLGFGPDNSLANYHSHHLVNEQILLIVRRDLMEKHYSNLSVPKPIPFSSAVDLTSFPALPYMLPPDGNYTHKVMNSIFLKRKITPNIVAQADSGDILIQMAKGGMGATFCLKSVLIEKLPLFRQNQPSSLCAFPLQDEEARVDIALYVPYDFCENEAVGILSDIIKEKHLDLCRIADQAFLSVLSGKNDL